MRSHGYRQLDQLAPDRHQFRMVELEAGDCCPSRGSLSADFTVESLGPFEVILPTVLSGMKQRHGAAGRGIGKVDVGPLAIVAVRASVGQIIQNCRSASRHGNNVINFKAADMQTVGNPAVFTAPRGSLANSHPQLIGDSRHRSTASSGRSPTSWGATSCKRFKTFIAWSFCSVR